LSKPLRVLFVFGTRPEAVKLAPVIRHMRRRPAEFAVRTCATAQHRQMLDQVLELFDIQPDIDLNLMQRGQRLSDLSARLLTALPPVLREENPDWVVVQGDTTTVWTAALAAFYAEIPVAHVEAGLRTFDRRQPFPEEINRRLCTQLADLHFAPTQRARENLLREGLPDADIVVTGNTVVDALFWVLNRLQADPPPEVTQIRRWAEQSLGGHPFVLITGHRRESFGAGFQNICQAIANLAARFRHIHWVWPVHLNPNVQQPVRAILDGRPNVHLLEPLPYAAFCYLMSRCVTILSDSGGIQEEAPSLGKRVFVMRNLTERPEGVEAGCIYLVGTSQSRIEAALGDFLADLESNRQAPIANPYGDGHASERIAEALLRRRSPDTNKAADEMRVDARRRA